LKNKEASLRKSI